MKTKICELNRLIKGSPTSDGDGVKLTRMIGTSELDMLDPFVLFDVFESNQAQDYMGGFPDHPHRGFETVTYLLAGRMYHKDSAGHEGLIEPGGVQWMTAGKGIIHSEMPEQEEGFLQGFQLWVNLPADQKMKTPAYQEFSANEIAFERLKNGTEIRVIAGTTNTGLSGAVAEHPVNPIYMDISLPKGNKFEQNLSAEANAFIFVIDGEISIGNLKSKVAHRQLGVLDKGEQVTIIANKNTHFLLIAGSPLNEPVARGGPFVMNTKAEVLQAFEDYDNNLF